jgi:fructose-1,6-bisphosphatase/inositol monophosphatase family enzyme
MSYDSELAFAVRLARQAGEIMRANLDDTQVEWKSDNSPVTESDTTINQLVIDEVQSHFPYDGILGEEASFNPDRPRKWVVDPIDGTQAFDIGMPVSTFCLGLVVDGRPVLGVVYDPYLDRMYHAVRGGGAFINDQPIHVSDAARLEQQYLFLSSRMGDGVISNGEATDIFIAKGAKCFNVRSIVYGFTRVAAGRSLAALAGYSHPWDLAAALVILEEAGATVTDFEGGPLVYDQAEKGILASNGRIHQELLGYLRKN